MHSSSSPEDAADGKDASQWLFEYVCIRLAEHYPELWDAISPETVVIMQELVLDGMSNCPHDEPYFRSHLTFAGPLDDETA